MTEWKCERVNEYGFEFTAPAILKQAPSWSHSSFPCSVQDNFQASACKSSTRLENPHAGYLCNAEESLQALGCQEGLPARPEGDNVPQTEQEPVADQHVGVGHVVAVPVLMQPEQAGDIASVHCPAAVRLWRQRE